MKRNIIKSPITIIALGILLIGILVLFTSNDEFSVINDYVSGMNVKFGQSPGKVQNRVPDGVFRRVVDGYGDPFIESDMYESTFYFVETLTTAEFLYSVKTTNDKYTFFGVSVGTSLSEAIKLLENGNFKHREDPENSYYNPDGVSITFIVENNSIQQIWISIRINEAEQFDY